MAELRRIAASAPVEDVIRVLERTAGSSSRICSTRRRSPRSTARWTAWVADADPAMRHLNPAIQIFFGDRTKHVGGVAGKSRTFATEVMIHPLFMGVCDAILGPSCACYQLNLAHLIARGPGAERAVPSSRRARVESGAAPASRAAARVDRRPGGLRRRQRRDARRPRQPPVGLRAAGDRGRDRDARSMAAGSAVVYLGSTIHGGGANTTASTWRRGVHISYTLGWLRTEENNYLAVPPPSRAPCRRRCQEVLGYAVHDALPRTRRLPRHGVAARPPGAPGRGRARRVIALATGGRRSVGACSTELWLVDPTSPAWRAPLRRRLLDGLRIVDPTGTPWRAPLRRRLLNRAPDDASNRRTLEAPLPRRLFNRASDRDQQAPTERRPPNPRSNVRRRSGALQPEPELALELSNRGSEGWKDWGTSECSNRTAIGDRNGEHVAGRGSATRHGRVCSGWSSRWPPCSRSAPRAVRSAPATARAAIPSRSTS